MKNWLDIWEKKANTLPSIEDCTTVTIIDELIKADGFGDDGASGKTTVSAWMQYVDYIKKRMGIQALDAVYEVGTGSGALIYPMHKSMCTVGGLDFSSTHINNVSSLIENGHFEVCAACDMKATPRYDHVLSNSVFQYFPSAEYAEIVLNLMWRKSAKGIAILDVPDELFKDLIESKRKEACPEYDSKFEGLQHQYYSKEWFLQFAQNVRAKSITFDMQHIEGYGYNGTRMNVFIRR